jgi:hypothetical protein
MWEVSFSPQTPSGSSFGILPAWPGVLYTSKLVPAFDLVSVSVFVSQFWCVCEFIVL